MTLTELANPTRFLALTARLLPWLMGLTAIVLLIGLLRKLCALGSHPPRVVGLGSHHLPFVPMISARIICLSRGASV